MKNIEKELHQKPRKFYHDNLTKAEREALFSLRTRTDIIIKKADKGLATVVMSRENYVREVMRQLENEQHYLKLSEDPTGLFAEEIKITSILAEFRVCCVCSDEDWGIAVETSASSPINHLLGIRDIS